jgi:hypothetical protein
MLSELPTGNADAAIFRHAESITYVGRGGALDENIPTSLIRMTYHPNAKQKVVFKTYGGRELYLQCFGADNAGGKVGKLYRILNMI